MTKFLILTFYGKVLGWLSKPGHYLDGYTSKGNTGGQYLTLVEAKKQCFALPATDCGGITMYKEYGKTWYQLRKGLTPVKSPSGENSWLRPYYGQEVACDVCARNPKWVNFQNKPHSNRPVHLRVQKF